MSAQATEKLIRDYYDAFNAGDADRFLALLNEDVVHDVNQGGREIGKDAFRRFMAHMDRCYAERAVDLVVMVASGGLRASAEFVIEGRYRATDEGLPPATGQAYRLPVGAFFEIRDGKVARVTNYYNLKDWLRQVGG